MENRIFELIDIIDNEIQDSNASMVQAVNIGKHIDELKAKLRLVKKIKDDVSKSFYCETKRGCLEQCDDYALTELAKDMAC